MKWNQLTFLLLVMLLLWSAVLVAQTETAAPDTTADYKSTANSIFNMLYLEDENVIQDIDWTVFVLDGDNVAQRYLALTTDTERAELQSQIVLEIASLIYDEDDLNGYYDWDFYESTDGGYTLYSMTAYFDLYMDFQVKNGKLLLTRLTEDEY